jgi:hypothetical protein
MAECKHANRSNNPKLKDFLSLVQNKKNRQFSFVIKKRMFNAFDLTPKNILDMKIPKNKIKLPKRLFKSK